MWKQTPSAFTETRKILDRSSLSSLYSTRHLVTLVHSAVVGNRRKKIRSSHAPSDILSWLPQYGHLVLPAIFCLVCHSTAISCSQRYSVLAATVRPSRAPGNILSWLPQYGHLVLPAILCRSGHRTRLHW